MPHIHTTPGHIDFTVCVFVVYNNRVLLRLHDKHQLWLAPGGHIELDETPEEAALREVKEEVGLEVELYPGQKIFDLHNEHYQELIPPAGLNTHLVNPDHRHTELVYFATSSTDAVVEPEGEEKSGGIRWLTREEVVADPGLRESTKNYALKALALLGE